MNDEPLETCRKCKGKGYISIVCRICKGSGWVGGRMGGEICCGGDDTIECPNCEGTTFEPED